MKGEIMVSSGVLTVQILMEGTVERMNCKVTTFCVSRLSKMASANDDRQRSAFNIRPGSLTNAISGAVREKKIHVMEAGKTTVTYVTIG